VKKFRGPKRTLALLLVGVGVVTLAGCGAGLPKELVGQTKDLLKSVEATQLEVDQDRANFSSFQKTDDYLSFLKRYAEREKWEESFNQATRELANVKKTYTDLVEPLLKKNKPELAQELTDLVQKLNARIKKARATARAPTQRATFLSDARKNAQQLVAQAEQDNAALEVVIQSVETKAHQAQKDYEAKREDIDGRLAPFTKWGQEAHEGLNAAEAELAKDEAGRDYAVLADGATLNGVNLEQASKQGEILKGMLAELYDSFSRILEDQKADYFVSVVRQSWNAALDGGERQYKYPAVLVDGEVYEVLTGLTGEATIATISNNRYLKLKIDQRIWDALNINPTDNWPSNHNSAQFWIEGGDFKAFHKYVDVRGVERTETDWIEVDQETYEHYFNCLDMTIAAKPYGMYLEEESKECIPAGMEYVGNPKYGTWKKDGRGDAFWDFYVQYAVMRSLIWGPVYSPFYRSAWSPWYTGGYWGTRPYYGVGTTVTYGTYGAQTRQSPKYTNSSFEKRGGTAKTPTSIRNAGTAARTRGPGSGK